MTLRARRRQGISWRRPSPIGLGMTVLLVGLLAYRSLRPDAVPDSFPFDSPGPFLVTRAVDGDTLLLEGGSRVRLIGVDTPETKHPTWPVEPLGLEAAQFTRTHVEGRYVTLKFDRERRDVYHRVLAYVFVDDWFLNEELIFAGYSRAQTRFPYSSSMKRRFRNAEQKAHDAHRGLWAQGQRMP